MSNKLSRLSEAGFQVSPANESQRAVLESLSDDEIGVLLSVKGRIDGAGSDVEGHTATPEAPGDNYGGWLW